ncbi:MAG: ferritin-like domain-containing protein [Acidobacteriaceae bacterium]
MANQETQLLDNMIATSRRKMLTLGAASLAGLAFAASAKSAEAATPTYSDNDILNFALNLEYLEANFYYLAAFGTTIDKANTASVAAGGPAAGIPITGSVGTAGTVSGGSMVPFTSDVMGTTVGSYATETAIEEGKHVLTLQSALGTLAVAQPAINLGTSFQTLAAAANKLTPAGNIPAAFSPYAAEADFLVGAYVFEDVGVTAYHGAASLLTMSSNLEVAAGILGVEAYHAGLIRTTLNYLDPTGSVGLVGYTDSISALRSYLASAGLLGVAPTASQYDSQSGVPDDYGLMTFTTPKPLGGGSTATSTRIVDADPTNVVAFARNPTQVLNIVTGGGAVNGTTVMSPATGVFFPNGMNAGPNGFK